MKLRLLCLRLILPLFYHKVDFRANASKIFSNPSSHAAAKSVLEHLKIALDVEGEEVNISVQYKHAKNFVNSLLAALFTSLRWLKTLVQDATSALESGANSNEESRKIYSSTYQTS